MTESFLFGWSIKDVILSIFVASSSDYKKKYALEFNLAFNGKCVYDVRMSFEIHIYSNGQLNRIIFFFTIWKKINQHR